MMPPSESRLVRRTQSVLCSTGNATEPLYTDGSFTGNSPIRVWMQLCFTGNDVAEARGFRVVLGHPSHRGRASSGGSGTSLSTCSSSGGSALSRSASTSAGAALRAIGEPPARVSREASTPAALSPAVLVCACTNDFEPPLSGESYAMANGSEKGVIASSAPAVTVQHSVPFHGKLAHRTLPSAAGPTLRCVRRERFAGEGGWGRMEQDCVPNSFGRHADGASRSCFTGNMLVTCTNVGPHHRCREKRRAARTPIPLPGGFTCVRRTCRHPRQPRDATAPGDTGRERAPGG